MRYFAAQDNPYRTAQLKTFLKKNKNTLTTVKIVLKTNIKTNQHKYNSDVF